MILRRAGLHHSRPEGRRAVHDAFFLTQRPGHSSLPTPEAVALSPSMPPLCSRSCSLWAGRASLSHMNTCFQQVCCVHVFESPLGHHFYALVRSIPYQCSCTLEHCISHISLLWVAARWGRRWSL